MQEERVWLSEYEEGVPADLNCDRYSSLMGLLEESFSRNSDAVAIIHGEDELTFRQLDESSRSFAAFLCHMLHMEIGNRLAILLPNCPQYIIAGIGAFRAGMPLVGMNPKSMRRELAILLADCTPTTAVIASEQKTSLLPVLKEAGVQNVITVGSECDKCDKYDDMGLKVFPFSLATCDGLPKFYVRPLLSGDMVACIQYTGGTTGIPKGAMLSNRNLVFAVLAQSAWTGKRLTSGDIVFQMIPLYHVFGLVAVCVRGLYMGLCTFLPQDSRDFPALVESLKKLRPEFIPGVATVFHKLLQTPGIEEVDFSGLKLCVSGGMPTREHTLESWQRLTGCPIHEGYALTESSSCCCQSPYNKQEPGWVGIPYPSTYMSIRSADGEVVAPNTEGEIYVKGPQVMLGYWNKPKETAEVLTKDGWLRTGDIGVMDSRGYVRIMGRLKESIIVSGFNVYPNEVEATVRTIPEVVDAACVGVPNPVSGEAVRLYVVKKNQSLTEEDILAVCKENLLRYKIPKEIIFVDSIPRSNTGKILRKALRNITL